MTTNKVTESIKPQSTHLEKTSIMKVIQMQILKNSLS